MSMRSYVERLISVTHRDPGLAIRSQAFNILVLGFWGLMILISVILILHWVFFPTSSYGITTVVALTTVNTMLPASFILCKRGHFRAAVWTFLAMLFIGTFVAHIARGDSNAIILIYPIVMITAGLLLDFRSVLVALPLSITTYLAASFVVHRWGPYLVFHSETMALNNSMAVIASLIVITLITWLFTKNTRAYIEQLEASNREKEVLLKEIHHRVKNNLQIVSSLLNLQSEGLKDEHSRKMLRENVGRVKSMALVHETLYSSNNIADIRFGDYLYRLLNNINQTMPESTAISIRHYADDSELDIDSTLSLGLIINELVTNSVKHAFNEPDPKEPEVTVKFRKSNDQVELVVADNGAGLPDKLRTKKPETLGMELVRTLVEELGGKIKIDGKGGTTVRVRFKDER